MNVTTRLDHPAVLFQVDFEGDGVFDLTTAEWTDVNRTFSIPGLYIPTVSVTDSAGGSWAGFTVVNVLDRTTFGARIEQQLNAMRSALLAGDVETALNYFGSPVRDRYREKFLRLQPDLSRILSSIEQFHLVEAVSEMADAEAIRTRDGVSYSYPITILRDEQGFWKIGAF